VTDEKHIMEVSRDHGPHHVLDMRVESDGRREQWRALGEAGGGDGDRLVSRAEKRPGDIPRGIPPLGRHAGSDRED
jgi:hypothetical protein